MAQGVAADHDGVSASFDNDPAATDLVYLLAGACLPVPGSAITAPAGAATLPPLA